MKKVSFLCLLVCAFLVPRIGFSGNNCREQLNFPEKPHSTAFRGFNPSLEIVQARTPNTKVFKTEDYIVYRIFSHPIHRINDHGKLEDIIDSCGCLNWQIDEYYSGYADGLFEEMNVCGSSATYIQVNDTYYYRGFVEFDTDAIPDTATIDSVFLNLYCVQWLYPTEGHDIWSMENEPSISQAMTVYYDAADGNCYISNYMGGAGWNIWNLGIQASQRLDSLLPEDWFAIGLSGFNSSSAGDLMYQCGTGYIDVYEPVGIKKNKENLKLENGKWKITILPNPFTQKTVIEFRSSGVLEFNSQLPNSSTPQLKIYDVSGRLVRSFPSSLLSPRSSVVWQGMDNYGKKVSTGTYFCRLKVDNKVIAKKITLIRKLEEK